MASLVSSCGESSNETAPAGQSCTQGETRCDGDLVIRCNASDVWEIQADCALTRQVCRVNENGAACRTLSEGGADEPAGTTCEVGKVWCDGNDILRCMADGETIKRSPCGEGYRCDDATLVCVSTVEVPDPVLECSYGESKCDGDRVYRCSIDGMWEADTDCSENEGNALCEVSNGSASCVGTCTPYSFRCAGNSVEQCVDGAYVSVSACGADETCDGVNGICKPNHPEIKDPTKVCEVGAVRCNGNVSQRCTEDGAWVDDVDCAVSEGDEKVCEMSGETAVCVTACTDGAYRCFGSSLEQCAEGVYAAVKTCAETEICDVATGDCRPDESAVVTPECMVGAQRCNGSVAQTCSARGLWTDRTDCAQDETGANLCELGDGGAVCVGTCTPGYSICRDGALMTCSEEGAYVAADACNGENQRCDDNGDGKAICTDTPESCVRNMTECINDGASLKYCNELLQVETVACANYGEGYTCVTSDGKSSCVAPKCTEGISCRNARTLVTCTNGEESVTDCMAGGKSQFRCMVQGGVPGCYELNHSGNDTDGDTIPDSIEGIEAAIDTDGDTIPDYKDTDSDNDTIPDSLEGYADDDGDTIPNFRDLDSDGNGIPDAFEGCNYPYVVGAVAPTTVCDTPVDTDGNGIPDFIDNDNDGDTIPDVVEIRGQSLASHTDPASFSGACVGGNAVGTPENPVDCNKDGVADYMSKDSDGDTVPDAVENVIFKGDVYARYSLDTDKDGVPDSVEALPLVGGKVPDSDNDTIPDIISLDSDSDGLSDYSEYALEMGYNVCKALGLRTHKDSDGDGYIDSAEYAVAQKSNGKYQPYQLVCDAAKGVKDVFEFYFELPVGTKDDDVLTFVPKVSKLDVVFNIDTTGSMGDTVKTMQTNIKNIITSVRGNVSDAGFTLSMFDDFYVPNYDYGSSGDLPVTILGQIETSAAKVETYTNNSGFYASGGADGPESGVESLYQIVTRAGVSWMDRGTRTWKTLSFPSMDAGRWGGAGFRKDTLPVIIHVSDVTSHDKTSTKYGTDCNASYNTSVVTGAHYTDDLVPKLKSTGTRVISLNVGSGDSCKQMTAWSRESNAVVPVCAFKTGESTWSCDANTCCLGTKSAPTTVNGKANQCILKYTGSQSSVATYITQGVEALVKYGTYEVATKIRGENTLSVTGKTVNTACFIDHIEAKTYIAPPTEPEKSCNPKATPSKITIDSKTPTYNNGFVNFAPGTASTTKTGAKLQFTVYAKNDECHTPGTETEVFNAYIDVYNPTTGLLFDTQKVAIVVPGVPQHANE